MLEEDEELGRGPAEGLASMASDTRVVKGAGEWVRIGGADFLDAQKTSGLHRLLRWPGLFEGGEFADYALFEYKTRAD